MIAHMGFAWVLFALLVGHFLADYPLQGDFLSRAKDRNSELGKEFGWHHAMCAHVMIHAGFVAAITGSLGLAFLEAGIHFVTDRAKCDKRISINTDQAVHITCKYAWAAITVWWLS